MTSLTRRKVLGILLQKSLDRLHAEVFYAVTKDLGLHHSNGICSLSACSCMATCPKGM